MSVRAALRRRCVAAFLAIALLVFQGPARAVADTVDIFAAASLKPALDAIAADPALVPQDIDLRLTYGGSSALARQIQYGAPAQIFLSANTLWMDALDQQGLLAPGSRQDLLGNALVLIAAPGSNPDITGIADLSEMGESDYLAMALVNAVPAGIYGREALQSLGLWEGLRTRVVQGDNVRAALRLVEAGETAFGITYATDPGPDSPARVIAAFPSDSHSPIRYPVAMIGTPDAPTRQIYDLLRSDAARAAFADHGFQPLADPQ